MLADGANHVLIVNAARLSFILLGLLASGALAHPDLETQIEALDQAIIATPGDASLYLQRGDLHRRHGDFETAQADFDQARLLDPKLSEIDLREGQALVDAGQLAAGEALLDRYLARFPDRATALVARARARSGQGQHREAATDYAAAIDNSQRPAPVLFSSLALERLASEPPDTDSAGEVLDAALQRFPAEVSLLGLAVDLALAEGQIPRAGTLLNRAPPALGQLPQWAWRQRLLDCLSGAPDAKPALQAMVGHMGQEGARSGTWQPPSLNMAVPAEAAPSEWCRAVARASLKREIELRLGTTPSP